MKPDDWADTPTNHAVAEGINRLATELYRAMGSHHLVEVVLKSRNGIEGLETSMNTAVGPVTVRVDKPIQRYRGQVPTPPTPQRAVAERILEQLCDPDGPPQVLGSHVDLPAFIEGATTALGRHPPDDIRDRLETAIRQATRMLVVRDDDYTYAGQPHAPACQCSDCRPF